MPPDEGHHQLLGISQQKRKARPNKASRKAVKTEGARTAYVITNIWTGSKAQYDWNVPLEFEGETRSAYYFVSFLAMGDTGSQCSDRGVHWPISGGSF